VSKNIIVVTAVLISIGRFTVPGHGLSWPGSYEALAHIWIGVMVAVTYYRWRSPTGWAALTALVATSALETVMFLTR
jgi:hypothetical protein